MRIYLTDRPSDVSGYKLALIDTRDPAAGTLVTSVTNTSGSGDNIAATDTAGGTELKWLTKPLLADTVIPAQPTSCNVWAKESNASANASVGFRITEYDGSEGSAIVDHNDAVELTTSIANKRLVSAAPSATTIDAGHRIALHLDAVAVGTMGGSQTVTMDYAGATEGSDGDTFIDIPVPGRANEIQLGAGGVPVPLCSGFGKASFQATIDALNALVGAKVIAANASVQAVLDELGYQRDAL